MTSIARLALVLLIHFGVLFASPAVAHLTPGSEVGLTIGTTDVRADIIIPLSEYRVATSFSAGNDPPNLLHAKTYIEERFKTASPDGRPWAVRVDFIAIERTVGSPDIRAAAILTPPPGVSPRQFVVEWRAVIEEIPSHVALFVIRRDIAGKSGTRAQIVGAARSGAWHVRIDVGRASKWREFRNSVELGIDHILDGYDHLMFLLALLLPAPLVAKAGRWAVVRDRRSVVVEIVRVVTAFTIGHSLTLIGATIGGWRLPVQPVEIAIAGSVMLSAAHAVRPLFPGREPLVAGLFGLVHGLAFATLVSDLHLGSGAAPIALAGFNVGIELIQLAIVLVAVPALMLLARYPFYRQLRTGLAAVGLAAAAVWMLDRALGIGGRFAIFAEGAILATALALAMITTAMLACYPVRHLIPRSRPAS